MFSWLVTNLVVCQAKWYPDASSTSHVDTHHPRKYRWEHLNSPQLGGESLKITLQCQNHSTQVSDVTFAHFQALLDCHLIVLTVNSNDTKGCCKKLAEVMPKPKTMTVFSLQRGVRNSSITKDEWVLRMVYISANIYTWFGCVLERGWSLLRRTFVSPGDMYFQCKNTQAWIERFHSGWRCSWIRCGTWFQIRCHDSEYNPPLYLIRTTYKRGSKSSRWTTETVGEDELGYILPENTYSWVTQV